MLLRNCTTGSKAAALITWLLSSRIMIFRLKYSELKVYELLHIVMTIDWPDRTVGLGPDRTGLILVRSSPKVKDRTVKQSPFLVWTRLKLL
jgi:hypothetical protein